MPFLGLGLHVLIAIYFAVHAVRTGQQLFWLFILFSFPLLGSIVYALVIYLPQSRLQQGTRKAVAAATRVLDPNRELREAREAFDYTPTAANQMRLAAALLDAGFADEAATNYEACLTGPFAGDLEIRFGAARARYSCAHYDGTLRLLAEIRQQDPEFRAEAVALLQAQALAGSGQGDAAGAAFGAAASRFGSFDVKGEYFLWAVAAGQRELALGLQQELQRITERWPSHTRELNRALLRRLEAGYASLR
jgi:hypothetical protein